MKETLTVAFFVIGNLIGAGFFLLPASLAPLGYKMIFSWIIALLIALTYALIFGKLYMMFPKSNVLSDYFEDSSMQKSIALSYWVSSIFGNAVLLLVIFSSLNIKSYLAVWGMGVMFFLTYLNHHLDYESIAKLEIILSLVKFSLLIFLPLYLFLKNYNLMALPPSNAHLVDVCKLGVAAFWSFIGIETAGVFGNGKNAKNGLLIGVVSSFILYVFCSFLIISIVPAFDLINNSQVPLVILLNYLEYGVISNYIAYLIAFSAFGALYGWIATTGKIALFYAKSNVFPDYFLKTTKSETSFIGLWGSSIASYLLFVSVNFLNIESQFDLISLICVYATLLIYALCASVLYNKSDNWYDQILSLLGIYLVLFALSFDIKYSLAAVIFFIICYLYNFSKESKIF